MSFIQDIINDSQDISNVFFFKNLSKFTCDSKKSPKTKKTTRIASSLFIQPLKTYYPFSFSSTFFRFL